LINNILLRLAPDGATFCRTCGAVLCLVGMAASLARGKAIGNNSQGT